MTVAAISTVAISLLLLGGVQILGIVVNNVTGTWEAKVEVSAFLRDGVTPTEQEQLIRDVTAMPEVQDLTVVSSAEALEEFKETFPDRPELWENLDEDSLPASLRIKLHDASDHDIVAATIDDAPI